MKSKVRVVEHRDGDEYLFNCPNCGEEISVGAWETSTKCPKCESKIKISSKQIEIILDKTKEV